MNSIDYLRRETVAKNNSDAENAELKRNNLRMKKEVHDMRRQTVAKNKTDAENAEMKKTILTMKKEVDDLKSSGKSQTTKNQSTDANVWEHAREISKREVDRSGKKKSCRTMVNDR